MRSSSKRPSDRGVSIRESDPWEIEKKIKALEELMRGNLDKTLAEYVEILCLFRMSFFGYVAKDDSHIDRFDVIINRLDQNGDDHGPKLPEKFEAVRKALLEISEQSHFERLLRAVRPIA